MKIEYLWYSIDFIFGLLINEAKTSIPMLRKIYIVGWAVPTKYH